MQPLCDDAAPVLLAECVQLLHDQPGQQNELAGSSSWLNESEEKFQRPSPLQIHSMSQCLKFLGQKNCKCWSYGLIFQT